MDKREIIQNYNGVSENEKRLRTIRSDFDLVEHYTEVKIAFAPMNKGSIVLDIGCGEGFDLISFEKAGMIPLGLDISMGMLKRCRRQFRGALVCADADHMPFRDSSFDIIHSREISFFNSYNKKEIIGHLKEVRRVLKEGGKVISMLPTKDYEGSGFRPYNEKELKELYGKSDFRNMRSIYPMNSRSLKISKRVYRLITRILKSRSFFIIGFGSK